MPGRGKGKGYNGYKWIRLSTRYAIYARDQFKCVWCSTAPLRLSLDHLMPWSKGGGNHPTNLVTCCFACNAKRGNLSPQCWAECFQEPNKVLARVEQQTATPINRYVGRELAMAQKKKPWRVPAAMEDRSFQHVIDIRGYEPIEEIDEDFCDVPF